MDSIAKKGLVFVGATAALTGVALTAVPLAVGALGFTSAGVAAASYAAAYQSTQAGVIAAGSAFSVLQSVGAAGLAVSTKAAITGACALVAKKFV